MPSYTCEHMLATRASTLLVVRARLLFKNVRPGQLKTHTKNMIFGRGPPSFVFISPHISGVSPNMTCQTPQPLIKSSNTRFLSDPSPIIALPCHSVTHCRVEVFDLGTGWVDGLKTSLGTGTERVMGSAKI